VPLTPSFGSQQPINRISDLLRHECAAAGFTEALNWGLCSHSDAFANMQRVDDGRVAVVLLAPKTADFEITRPTLLPGLLRTMESNKSQPLPIKMFEVSDVCVQCSETDTGATNLRRLAVLQTGTRNDDGTYGSGLELTIGLLDHIMLKLGAVHRSLVSSSCPPRGGVCVAAALSALHVSLTSLSVIT
jgi:phenylalanyl-tRNA synthetase beta chain